MTHTRLSSFQPDTHYSWSHSLRLLTLISQSHMNHWLFCFGSFSVPLLSPTPTRVSSFFIEKQTQVYCAAHWWSPFSASVQKPFLFYVVGNSSTVFDVTLLLWACRDTVAACVYPPTVTIVESFTLIYWLVSSSILTPQSFNLPKDCHNWSCSAWFISSPACSMLAALPGLFYVRQPGFMKIDGGRYISYILAKILLHNNVGICTSVSADVSSNPTTDIWISLPRKPPAPTSRN